MADRFPFPVPNGWFGLRYSDELAPGQVETVRGFGRELVAFRGEDGAVHVLDAHCPHLGAHLGVGGTVVGGALRCPFHAWEWDGATGACTKIPYARRIPKNAGLRSWTTVERNGVVFVWYHAEGKEPDFEIPEFPEATSPDWSDPDRYEFTVRSHNQEMGENAVDSAHFRYVHGTLNVPPAETREDGPRRSSLQRIEMKTPRGEMRGADPRPRQADEGGHPDLGAQGAPRLAPPLRGGGGDRRVPPLVPPVLLTGRPGLSPPSNISFDGRDRFWIGLVYRRDALLDWLRAQSGAWRKLVLRLPFVETLAGPAQEGFVIGLDPDGNVVANLQDPSGRVFAVTHVAPRDSWLYLGSLGMPAVARIPVP